MTKPGDNHAEPTGPVEPKWNAADPYGSVYRYAIYLHQKARLVFLKDKTHVELMFVFRSKGETILMQVPSDKRDEFISDVRKLIKDSDVVGVIHIAEAWTRAGDSNDHITKQLHYGEIKISDLRPEDRGEALIVSLQGRDGSVQTWIDPIMRDKARGTVSLGEGFEIKKSGGKMGNIFA